MSEETHTIDPRVSLGFCARCGAAGIRGVAQAPSGAVPVAKCPQGHGAWQLQGATATDGAAIALELVNLPRTLVREVFERIEAAVPDRGKIVARYAAAKADESILDFFTKERVTLPRDGGRK